MPDATRAADLSHGPRGWQTSGVASPNRRPGIPVREVQAVLKEAADKAGKPVYMELSSINPVYVFAGGTQRAWREIVEEFVTSCLMGTGQFCTNPGIVVLIDGPESDAFIEQTRERFGSAPVGTLLTGSVERSMVESVATLQKAGAEVVIGGQPGGGNGYGFNNTLLRVSGDAFLADPEALQTEAFGNESLLVIAKDADQAVEVARHFEGNLTGCIYSDSAGADESALCARGRCFAQKSGAIAQ